MCLLKTFSRIWCVRVLRLHFNILLCSDLTKKRDGTALESFVSVSLEDHRHRPNFEMQETSIKYAAAQIFGGDIYISSPDFKKSSNSFLSSFRRL